MPPDLLPPPPPQPGARTPAELRAARERHLAQYAGYRYEDGDGSDRTRPYCPRCFNGARYVWIEEAGLFTGRERGIVICTDPACPGDRVENTWSDSHPWLAIAIWTVAILSALGLVIAVLQQTPLFQ